MRLRSTNRLMIPVAALAGTAMIAGCTSSSTHPSSDSTRSATTPSSTTQPPATASGDTATQQPASPAPSSEPGTVTASPASMAMPTAAGLVAFVRAGAAVDASSYERGTDRPGQPLTATPGVIEFMTPSGNLACSIEEGTGSLSAMTCSATQYTYPTPAKPATCQLNYAPGYVSLSSTGVQRGMCLSNEVVLPYSEVLPYGSTVQTGVLACRSEAAFLACADVDTGHGFAVDRSTLRTY